MAIDLYDYGHNFNFVKRYQSIPPLFSIGVWHKRSSIANGTTSYGGYCFSRDSSTAGGLIVSGAGSGPKVVFDYQGGAFNRDTGLVVPASEWVLLVGTAAPGVQTTWMCKRSDGSVAKEVNTLTTNAVSFKTWYVGIDSFDAGRRAVGQYAMVALEQATWSENDIRRLLRGEPIERVRPQAYSLMRALERRRTDRGDQRLISSAALKTVPNPSFLRPRSAQLRAAPATSPPPPPSNTNYLMPLVGVGD